MACEWHREKTAERQVVLRCRLSPGDIVVMSAAVKALHSRYPGQFDTWVDTPCPSIWDFNPHVAFGDPSEDAEIVEVHYGSRPEDKRPRTADINKSNQSSAHFIDAFCEGLGIALGLEETLRPIEYRGDIYLSDQERLWFSQVHEIVGDDRPYWIINAGTKQDYTCKGWPHYQQLVRLTPDILWIQIGALEHLHNPLTGDNVIDLRGQTDLRQLIRLVYHTSGVVTGVSLPMHLAAAVPQKQGINRRCVTIMGGREPQAWNTYYGQQLLHTIGEIDCCRDGGCWKSRTVAVNDGSKHNKNLCLHPMDNFPLCMQMISPEFVAILVKRVVELHK